MQTLTETVGRLSKFIKRWQKITADPIILKCIKGYQLEFDYFITLKFTPNEPVCTLDLKQASLTCINDMLISGALDQCNFEESKFISTYFLRKKPDGSNRLFLKLKNLSKFLKTDHFKVEQVQNA